MKTKSIKLLRILLESNQINASTLADKMGVSVRSVKNYVKEINDEFGNVVSSSRDGYKIDEEKAHEILQNEDTHIPQTSEERVTYIINQLIHHNGSNRVIDQYDLCDELYISMSTLQKELNKVKRKLIDFDLTLTNKGTLIQVVGLEKNKRKLLSSILYDESNVNFINIKSLQNSFIDIDIEQIKEIVLSIFKKHQYFINDYSLINLVLHITIAIDRVRNNYINIEEITDKPSIRFHEHQMAQELANAIELEFDVKLNSAEVYEMTLLIISRATTIDYKSINETNIESFIGKDTFKLVKKLIQGINTYYYINISEPEFLVRFALHIHNLLLRVQNNYLSKNPLTEGIKTACPLIYDMSVNLANELQIETGIKINEDEIAYIAFHLGSTLEEQRGLESKITAVLYCPNYYDISLKLFDTIRKHFGNELLITNILKDESEIDKVNDIDLIITTIPLSKVNSIPYLQINLFFKEKDKVTLKDKIKQIQTSKKKKEFENLLREMIQPDFFTKKKQFMNQEHCIDFMVDQLIMNNCVGNTFKDEIMYRESVSSTAFGNFAIPHAMKMYAKKTSMYVVISEEPIEWGIHNVNLIIMMSFNRNERHLFNKTFEPITMILSEPENTKKLINSNSYDEFINMLVEML